MTRKRCDHDLETSSQGLLMAVIVCPRVLQACCLEMFYTDHCLTLLAAICFCSTFQSTRRQLFKRTYLQPGGTNSTDLAPFIPKQAIYWLHPVDTHTAAYTLQLCCAMRQTLCTSDCIVCSYVSHDLQDSIGAQRLSARPNSASYRYLLTLSLCFV